MAQANTTPGKPPPLPKSTQILAEGARSPAAAANQKCAASTDLEASMVRSDWFWPAIAAAVQHNDRGGLPHRRVSFADLPGRYHPEKHRVKSTRQQTRHLACMTTFRRHGRPRPRRGGGRSRPAGQARRPLRDEQVGEQGGNLRVEFGLRGPVGDVGVHTRHSHQERRIRQLVAYLRPELHWLRIQHSPSFVGEPQCNGVIERFMRTLKEHLWVLKTACSVISSMFSALGRKLREP